MLNKNNTTCIESLMNTLGKKDPPKPIVTRERENCRLCNLRLEDRTIRKGDMLKLIAANGNCPSLKPGDIVKIDYILRQKKRKIKKIMIAGYPFKLASYSKLNDGIVQKVCSSCGEPIS